MKKTLTLLFIFMYVGIIHAQKVKFKDDVVLIDGIECLKYDSEAKNVMIMGIDDKQTIILKYIGQPQIDLYTKVVFVEQNKSFTSKSYIFTKKDLVKKLIKNGVLNSCKFDESKIDKFILRYDESIECVCD